jgi:putative spermidine/putrescine transport system substrate-binding protein
MRAILGAVLMASIAWGGAAPGLAQIDLTPPKARSAVTKPPAKPSPKPRKPPPQQAPAAEPDERIEADDAQDRIFALGQRIQACSAEAEKILRFEPVVELDNDKCVEASVLKLREVASEANDVIAECPAMKEIQELREEIDLAIKELNRKRSRTATPQAQTIYDRKIEALSGNDPILKNNEKRLKTITAGIANKLVTIEDVIQACAEETRNSDIPVRGDLEELVAAAKAEGTLATMALPRDWCGFGGLMDSFAAKYGLKIVEMDPDANSDQQLDAVRTNAGGAGPDVVEISFFHGPKAKADGLLQPYKVTTWNSIPGEAKDPDGFWYGDYFHVIAFAVNTDVVADPPLDWRDLLGDDFKATVALVDEPRRTNEALQAVYSAGLSATSGAGRGAGAAGLAYFAGLIASGAFAGTGGGARSLADGTTPVVIRWDQTALQDRDRLHGAAAVEVVVPKTGLVANPYVQAISARAPHPNAAKLWMEHLYSDEGQLTFLGAYCHPIRYRALAAAGAIPEELSRRLPPARAYAGVVFPDPMTLFAEREAILKGWDRLIATAER